jgi:hypothetical protein
VGAGVRERVRVRVRVKVRVRVRVRCTHGVTFQRHKFIIYYCHTRYVCPSTSRQAETSHR